MPNHDDAAAIGARIRERREEKGLTQRQVAEPGFSSGYISMIEGGHRRPSDDRLRIIAERLGMDLTEVLTGVPGGLEAELEVQIHLARRQLDEGELDLATEAVKRIRAAARDYGLNRVEARAEETLATVAERRADPEQALAHYRRAQELWQGEPIHLRVNAVTGIANCTRMLGDAHLAVHCLDTYCRDLIETKQPHPEALMKTYTEMVYAYFGVGLPDKAKDAARQAMRLESQADDPIEIACMHLTVAQSLLYERRYDDALQSIRRAHELYSTSGWRNKAAKARIAEGFVLCDKRDYPAACNQLMEALDLLRQSPNRIDEALALNQLAYATRRMGDPDAALRFLQQAAPLLHETDILERAFNLRETALCLASTDTPAAEEGLKQAIDLYRRGGAQEELVETFKNLGDLYASTGRHDRALATFREGLESVARVPGS